MTSLQDALGGHADCEGRFLRSECACFPLADLRRGTSLGGRLRELSGRSVLVLARDQLAAAAALIELDGVARRVVVRPPAVSDLHLPAIAAGADVDAVVLDDDSLAQGPWAPALRVRCGLAITPAAREAATCATEWVLLTSGTTGAPKMLAHTLATLTAPIGTQPAETDVVWSTFYDVRSYGGLQILLRAVCGRYSLVLPGPSEALSRFLRRLGSLGVTHVSGTPSHWRRALMSASAGAISPRYVRLSGEIADQGILDALAAFYPRARISHAFASTEAGVGFDVADGLAGFPARLIGVTAGVEVRIVDGALRLRSPRTALRYLAGDNLALRDAEGFVDTSDVVERRGDRYHFLGRKSGVINIGGLKVYPEEVEAVINRHPAVRMSLVHARRSSITGSLVMADVVLAEDRDGNSSSRRAANLDRDIIQLCRRDLAAHKVPVTIRFVSALEVAAAGKLARRRA